MRRLVQLPFILFLLLTAIVVTVGLGAGYLVSQPRVGATTAQPSWGVTPSVPTGGATLPIPLPTFDAAPLRRVVQPDMMAVTPVSVTPDLLAKVKKLPGVKDVTALDGGVVLFQSRQINLLGVDPSSFRSWMPPATAAKVDVWQALARNEIVLSDHAHKVLGTQLGTEYTIMAKTAPRLRLGASAALGLPGVDGLVSRAMGVELGLVPGVAVLVNAPSAKRDNLARQLRTVLGTSQVVDLRKKTVSSVTVQGRPSTYLDLYKQAALRCPGLSWTVLAAIGQVESDHGRNAGPSSAGALGPMQFMPATWESFGIDGDGDGKADIMNPYDAVPSAASYLCHNKAGQGGKQLENAVYMYNHSWDYVRKVLALAQAYASTYA